MWEGCVNSIEFSTLSMAAARGSRGEWVLSLSHLEWRSLSPLWLPLSRPQATFFSASKSEKMDREADAGAGL